MGHRHFVYTHKARHSVSVNDPGSIPSIDKGRHGFAGQKCAHTASCPLEIRQVFPAGPSLSGHISVRQNCFAPASDGFPRDFWLSSHRRAGARQGEKDKKHRKGALAGVFAFVNRWYDNSIVAYKTSTEQTVNLVLDTIRLAMRKEKERAAAELHLHSDQGFQYTSHAYFKLTQKYGITPSMSRRGNCYDNAMAENFFSILKTECIYRHKPVSFNEANEMIDRYIHFYNHERIQTKTGVAPLTLRHSA